MSNKLFSISAYPALNYTLEELDISLKNASQAGASNVFTSYHLPEVDYQQNEFINKFNQFCDLVEKNNLKLIIDVSGKSLENLIIPKCILALRLDYGFSDEEIVKLSNSNQFMIELNASVIKLEKIKHLIDLGLNIKHTRLSYNFYPKLYTGMDIEDLIIKNQKFKEYGFHIMAYIPGLYHKRAPLNEGLPTIEAHRQMNPLYSTTELLLSGVDEIGFGDSLTTSEELILVQKAISDFQLGIINIPINIYDDISETEMKILDLVHSLRNDESRYMHRSSKARGMNVLARQTRDVHMLDVTIDNVLYKRYTGELSIVKIAMPYNERVNVVGYIPKKYYTLIKMLSPKYKISFNKNII